MRRITLYIPLFVFAISCSNNSTDKTLISETKNSSADTINLITADTITITQAEKIITDQFLRLVKTIDTLGLRCDTIRYKKIGNIPFYPDKAKIRRVDNYFFYDMQKDQTIPFLHIKRCETDTNNHRQEWCKKWNLNPQNVLKANKIIQYFFTGGKNYIDGLIEEWQFPDNNTARLASEDLGTKQEMIYENRGAFVCYIDNYMYVFHSRASSFMYSIKPIFEKFVKENKATSTVKQRQQ